ncbi:MAG: hypothetical protein MJ001_01685 [Paludibacteraceae bacterium]|nr:hypothetical protein [Paludibacteraceae bacterium]
MARIIPEQHKRLYEELCLYIKKCTSHAGSLSNYTDFKRVNECITEISSNPNASILDYDDPEVFVSVVKQLKANKRYQEYNKKGNNQYSSTVLNYLDFLRARKFMIESGALSDGVDAANDNGLQQDSSNNENKNLDIVEICSAIKRTGLLYEDKLIQRYACSLMTKPFVILSGLAGSGKTQLALAFARAMSENVEQQLCVVPVGADWTNREPLLGYPNALKQGEYMQPESGALQIMMRALRNPQKPYFLVLDEMNLSYVERYFADFLSALESNQKIPLWEKPDECDSEVDASIALPKNLFIVGTINVDETTYMFSPKVLDRANVIEFKISDKEMEQFLGQDMNIDVHAADGACANMGQDFVLKATSKEIDNSELAQRTLLEFFKVLKKVNAEFGYRSATEIYRFIANAKACAEGMTEDEILDATIVQKLLPKLHGSRKKLEPALKALWGLCMTDDHKTEAITRENAEQYAKFAEAADKIQRMMQTALDNGFTSFAEA